MKRAKAYLPVNEAKLGSMVNGSEGPWYSALVHLPDGAQGPNTGALIKGYADSSTPDPVSTAGQQGLISNELR